MAGQTIEAILELGALNLDCVINDLLTRIWKGKESHSLLAKHLSVDVLRKLIKQKSKHGGTLALCIKSGVENPDSHVGIYATDPSCYSVFWPLFEPIIKDSHRVEGAISHPGADFSGLGDLNLDPDDKYVNSTRIRIARNVAGYGFSAVMDLDECVRLEASVKAALDTLEGDLKGKYHPLAELTDEDKKQLKEEHLLMHNKDKYLESAGCFRHWPQGRGIFVSEDRKACVWVGEEDQLRIQSIQKGGNISEVFDRLGRLANHLTAAIPFATTDQLGAITACPSNLGTGMRASVHIKVPLFSQDPTFKDFCKDLGCQVRGTSGENTEVVGGVYDVSNSRRLGLTERQAVLEMANGVQKLIAKEMELEGQPAA